MKRITIGIASGRKYENYLNWFLQLPDIKVIKLSHFENNFESISACDGVVLSGGEDIHPRFYKKPEYLREYDLHDIDEQRDDFEMRLLSFAEEKQIKNFTEDRLIS